MLVLVGFGPPRLVDRDVAPTVRLDTGALRQVAENSQPPEVTAQALLVYDVDAQRVLFKRNEEEALPPASLTKLMTALLVLEQGDLNARVTVEAGDLIGGATMGLQAGESLTVEQLLRGLLIPSGNDASMVLARHLSGSVAAFVDRMNERAAELGLAQTYFVNPHGLDADAHLSSAMDLLVLTQQLLAYSLFREIVATSSAEVAGHALQSTNQLLETFPGADGIKTGTTTAAGECLIASITRDGRRLLIVILGSDDRYGDARALYAAYENSFRWMDGDFAEVAPLNRVLSPSGDIWYLRSEGQPPQILQQRWLEPSLRAYRRLELPPPGQTWQPGMYAGVVEWRLGDLLIGNQTLILW